jgi:hypothetical protein
MGRNDLHGIATLYDLISGLTYDRPYPKRTLLIDNIYQ